MSRLVTVVSSNRADVTILDKLLATLAKADDIDLAVIATGMHADNDSVIRAALPENCQVHFAGTDLGTGAVGAARSMGKILTDSAEILERTSPDLLIVTGDRLDMAPVVLAATPFNIPIMHIHGGEITLGAIDDRVRHAITKLSHIHCAATQKAADNIISMGEEEWRVHVSGAPALDSLLDSSKMTNASFCVQVGISSAKGLRLVTVHPETNSTTPLAPAIAILQALSNCEPAPTIVSAPNSDPGGSDLHYMLQEFADTNSWFQIRGTLGKDLYANAMRFADFMIGNTSSGLIEAGLFGLPVINVGNRQNGREYGENVTNIPASPQDIEQAISIALNQKKIFSNKTPYGDGNTVVKILNIIKTLPCREKLLLKCGY